MTIRSEKAHDVDDTDADDHEDDITHGDDVDDCDDDDRDGDIPL